MYITGSNFVSGDN